MKTCTKCLQTLPLSSFHKKTGTRLQSRCKTCVRRPGYKPRYRASTDGYTKTCGRCRIPQPLDNFYRSSSGPEYRQGYCISCVRELRGFKKPRAKTLAEAFWRFMKAGKPDECWPWLGNSFDGGGYGQFSWNAKLVKAHRVAYAIYRKTIPSGMNVLHRCDNPPCCNPRHLFLGTDADNVQDMLRKGRNRAKATPEMVREIRQAAATGEHWRKIALRYPLHEQTVYSIVSRKSWKHVE